MKLLKKAWKWFDDRTGAPGIITLLTEHKVPRTNWMYVFGSATLTVFILQVVTGSILATMYVTSTGNAYDSLQYITNDALFGRILRGIHFFGASAMILLVGLHMIRVFLTGSFKYPREMSWISGSILLLLTVTMGLLGQLMRWGQNAVWTIVVSAEQAGRTPFLGKLLGRFLIGGDTLTGLTLSRIFAAHVFFVPGLMIALIGFHVYLVMRNGISEMPKAGRLVDPGTYRAWYRDLLEREGEPFWPDAAWRDAVAAATVITAVVLLAIFVGAPPLDQPPDPSLVRAVPRPDWYLLWYFSVLAIIPEPSEPYVILGAPAVLVIVLMAVPFVAGRGERHPVRRPWAVAIVLLTVLMVGALTREAYIEPWAPDLSAKPLPVDVVGASSGPVAEGAILFHKKGCEYCHNIGGYGGHRGPNLSTIADRLSRNQLTARIMNGAINMPAFANNMSPEELNLLLAFLETRKAPLR